MTAATNGPGREPRKCSDCGQYEHVPKYCQNCGHEWPRAAPPAAPPAPAADARVPNDDEVICPGCVHQFRAIPVNVQADIAALRALIEQQARELAEMTIRAECAEMVCRDKDADWVTENARAKSAEADRDALADKLRAAEAETERWSRAAINAARAGGKT